MKKNFETRDFLMRINDKYKGNNPNLGFWVGLQ